MLQFLSGQKGGSDAISYQLFPLDFFDFVIKICSQFQNFPIFQKTKNVRKVLFEDLMEQDSKESSPRSLDKMLLKLQVNSQNVQNTQWSKFYKFSKFSKFLKCSKFKSCQITILKYSYDTKWCNHINSCHSKYFKLVLNPYGAIWYNHINLSQTWRNSTTCLDIFW